MSKNTESRLIRQWEERMVEDYYDYRCQLLLDPLYEDFQQWKEGALSHESMFDAIQRIHRENRERYNFFAIKREELARRIQEDPWFEQWLASHPAPEGADVLPAAPQDDAGAEVENSSGEGQDISR
jgi:hypothetical protein